MIKSNEQKMYTELKRIDYKGKYNIFDIFKYIKIARKYLLHSKQKKTLPDTDLNKETNNEHIRRSKQSKISPKTI